MAEATFYVQTRPARQVLKALVSAISEACPTYRVNQVTGNTNLKQPHVQANPGQPLSDFVKGNLSGMIAAVADHDFLRFNHLQVMLQLPNGNAGPIVYTENDNALPARLSVHQTEHWSPNELDAVIAALNKAFPLRPYQTIIAEGFSPVERESVRSYQTAVGDLTAAVSRLGEVTSRQSEELGRFVRDKLNELEERYSAKEQALEERAAQRDAELREREAAFDNRVKEFDARDRTVVRRDLLKSLRDTLKTQEEVRLSKNTISKRRVITGSCVLAMLVAVALMGVGIHFLFEPQFEWRRITPLPAGALLFVSTLVFFLRWNDAWFRDHARAEFVARKTTADMLRASWLAELYFEWKEQKAFEFPAGMVESFTRNLFVDAAASESVTHPIEQFLAAASKVKVKAGSVEVEPK